MGLAAEAVRYPDFHLSGARVHRVVDQLRDGAEYPGRVPVRHRDEQRVLERRSVEPVDGPVLFGSVRCEGGGWGRGQGLGS